VYAKALCLLLKALGGSEKSRFATAGTRNDVPSPSHTLIVTLATGWLHRQWRPETDLTRCQWDTVLAGWRLGLQSCTHAPASSPETTCWCYVSSILCQEILKQPASIVSFRQMQTFDQYLLFVAEYQCLQELQWRVNDVISAYQIYT